MKTTTSLAFAGVLLISIATANAQCGVERWPVKTATDGDAQYVSRAALSTTIAQLRSFPAPRPLPQASRLAPVEETIYSVIATLTAVKAESDSDYHLVLSDEEGRTIIAEIPSVECSGGGSFSSDIANARAAFERNVSAPFDHFRAVSIPVEIRGIGFFDYLHGQQGVAPNGIELHPVTSISFSPIWQPAPPPVISRRRAVAPSGAVVCAAPTLTISLSSSRACSGTPVTLSWQASDSAASVRIDGLGTGLASSGSFTIGSTFTTIYSGQASTACGAGDEATSVLTIVPEVRTSLTAPASVQTGGGTTLTLTVTNATGWSISSALGNTISPASGSSTGSFGVTYLAAHAGNDVITLSATNNLCAPTIKSAPITVGTSPPPPPPGGSLRCCDGTLSPTCTSCANKSGCCSHHGGVCGCN